MWIGKDRESLRGFFVATWRKHREGRPLEPVERLIAEVAAQHPEYHGELDGDDALDRDYSPEAGVSNPFLHMSMHIALHEQLAARRPEGIAASLVREEVVGVSRARALQRGGWLLDDC